jgi:hypothetical protein
MSNPDIAAAARRLAAHARYATGDMRPVQSADLVALRPMHEAMAAGRDDAGRVERWAREMCRLDGTNPDQAMSRGRGPWWTAYRDDAIGIIALADAETTARLSAIFDRWSRQAHVRLHAGEMTAQEMRSVQAVLGAVRREVEGSTPPAPP